MPPILLNMAYERRKHMDLQEYKCPCCGGAVEFNTSVQKVKCPYCDSEFEMDYFMNHDSEPENEKEEDVVWESNEANEWQDGETDGLRTYICKSCGGEIVGDESMAATSCPYCDNPIVLKGQFSGDLKPDYVIPFKYDKEAAKSALRKHYQGKRLLPKAFKDENRLDEIKGIYVPFWLFDADTDAHIKYEGCKVRHWSDSRYDYTEKSYYKIIRSGRVGFQRVPVDGSSKMPDELMESIEPFDFSSAETFQTAYLAGYLADRYDVEKDKCSERANERIKQSTIDKFRETVTGYSSVETTSSNVKFKNGKCQYVLYPVWLLTTKWNGKNYTFAMNGQTGKFVGNLPVDKTECLKLSTLIFLGVSAAALIFQLILL